MAQGNPSTNDGLETGFQVYRASRLEALIAPLWALLDLLSFTRRTARPLQTAPAGPFNDVIVVVGGLVTYAVILMWAHRALIGVSPLG